MLTRPTCLICDRRLLRHARAGGGIFWFCHHCWQEMPVFCQEQLVFVRSKVKRFNQIKLFRRNENIQKI